MANAPHSSPPQGALNVALSLTPTGMVQRCFIQNLVRLSQSEQFFSYLLYYYINSVGEVISFGLLKIQYNNYSGGLNPHITLENIIFDYSYVVETQHIYSSIGRPDVL